MAIDYPQLIDRWEKTMREGHGKSVAHEMVKLERKRVPRRYCLPIAKLARRCDFISFGLKLLNPIIRTENDFSEHASNAEKAEYAILLTKVGAVNEALELLNQVNAEHTPEVNLAKVFALVSQWNYADTVPVLHQYLKSRKLTDYERLVGKANLAAALTYAFDSKAEDLLDSLLQETNNDKHKFLYGKTLILVAQYAIGAKDWNRAKEFLDKAQSELLGISGIDAILAMKWRAVIHLKNNPDSPTTHKHVLTVRDMAIQRSHWETVRHLDYYQAICRHDSSLLTHVYFGTPFEHFRERMVKEFGGCDIPKEYNLGAESRFKNTVSLNCERGEASNGAQLKVGQLNHRLLKSLCSDFYRPFRIASLHHLLYPGEFYNPLSSPERVLFAVKKLRKWFKSEKLPLSIDAVKHTFKLRVEPGGAIQLSKGESYSNKNVYYLEKLRGKHPTGPLSTREIAQILELSPRSTLRFIEAVASEGGLEKQGKGCSTKYQVK